MHAGLRQGRSLQPRRRSRGEAGRSRESRDPAALPVIKIIRELRIQKVSAFCPVQIAVRSCAVKSLHLYEADTGANVTWHPTHVL